MCTGLIFVVVFTGPRTGVSFEYSAIRPAQDALKPAGFGIVIVHCCNYFKSLSFVCAVLRVIHTGRDVNRPKAAITSTSVNPVTCELDPAPIPPSAQPEPQAGIGKDISMHLNDYIYSRGGCAGAHDVQAKASVMREKLNSATTRNPWQSVILTTDTLAALDIAGEQKIHEVCRIDCNRSCTRSCCCNATTNRFSHFSQRFSVELLHCSC